MSYEIFRTTEFTKHLKQLSKKYSSLKNDYSSLLKSLEQNPLLGIPLGKDCYKIRMKISSKNSLDIYDKSDKENITDKELASLIKKAEE